MSEERHKAHAKLWWDASGNLHVEHNLFDDDDERLKQRIRTLVAWVTNAPGMPEGTTTPPQASPAELLARTCPIHNQDWVEQTNRETGEKFKSHKLGNGWCNLTAVLQRLEKMEDDG